MGFSPTLYCIVVVVFFPFVLDIKFVGLDGHILYIYIYTPEYIFIYFVVRKNQIPFAGIKLASQRVRRLRGYL